MQSNIRENIMKYAQLIIGLLAGTAIGGAVVAGTGAPIGVGAGMDTESVKKIVREVIADEPKLIMESVQKFQMEEQKKQSAGASEMLKDKSVRDQLFNNSSHAAVGPKDSKRVVVEFFDYNCPVCKTQFKTIDAARKKDPTIRAIFIEYPIFGPVSDTNSKLGLAVARLYPEKYYDFHDKMMGTAGHGPGNNDMTFKFIKELGMDVDKVKAESEKKETTDILEKNHALGNTLNVRGTPLLIIGDEIIPHAIGLEELESRLSAAGDGGAKAVDAVKPE
jgi:protein-disulfide isomerase